MYSTSKGYSNWKTGGSSEFAFISVLLMASPRAVFWPERVDGESRENSILLFRSLLLPSVLLPESKRDSHNQPALRQTGYPPPPPLPKLEKTYIWS